MRFFILLLTLTFAFQPLFAQPIRGRKGFKIPKVSDRILSTQIQQRLPEETQRQQKEQAERRKWQNALDKLAERQNPLNWKEITWQEFLKQNKNAKGVEAVSTRLDMKCTEAYCELLPEKIPLKAIAKSGNSEVDYQTILSGYKLIYVGEGMNHDTQHAPLEMAKILRAAREANPGAKILLAAEFLVWMPSGPQLPAKTPEQIRDLEHSIQEALSDLDFAYNFLSDEGKMELERQYLQQKQEYLNHLKELNVYAQILPSEPLLKKAGSKSNLFSDDEYTPVFKAADELGIDQLALDDDAPGASQTNEIAAKIGEFIVWAHPQDKIPSWNALRTRSDSYEEERYMALQQNLGVSPWGVRERNREWARRIKILQPFYDIIIVYAGSGHLSNTYYMDLQPMVEQKDFLNITLYPMEDLPAAMQNYYNERFNAAEKNKITQDVRIWEEKQNAYENLEILEEPEDESLIWEDLQKPFWLWYSDNNPQLEQVMQTWDPQKTQVWEKEISKQNEMFPFLQTAHLEVYLPAK